MQSEEVERFGRWLMERVRDRSIGIAGNRLSGGLMARDVSEALKTLSDEQKVAVQELLLATVDDTLHSLLTAIENEADQVVVSVRAADGQYRSVAELSDGLSGELLMRDGWVVKYSKHPSAG
jgi:hypothetical protein